jgi:Glycosyltransferase family 28 C-terminal domain/Monogalactosyldiacylglycerol (MGDG) synthase
LRKLTIVFHNAGGGHRSAADALKATLSAQEHPWGVSLLDIQELLDPLDLIRRATGLRIQDTYNLILRKGWTRFTPQLLLILQITIRVYHSAIVKALRVYWAEHPADLVLSVIPHFNREIAESLRNGQKTPFVTLITDLADYPPHFWIERESEYIIAGTDRAREQALAIGHRTDHIFQTSGMILKPRFYEKTTVDRAAERAKLGLERECPTGIVLFGGHGSEVMLDIARKLNQSAADHQLIMICGHNQKLAARLSNLQTKKRMAVVGFTQNVEYYMALSDFFIGKPGPGSISEALQFHLPVIVECNSTTLPQERYNAQWVTEKGYGTVVPSFRKIASAVERLLERSTFAEFRGRASQYCNRALMEVPVILERLIVERLIVEQGAGQTAPPAPQLERVSAP